MSLVARVVVFFVVAVPLLMIGAGVSLGVLLATRPELFISEPEPRDAAQAFLDALARSDLDAARALLAASERDLEKPLGLLGWALSDVLSDVCPNSLELGLTERERTADSATIRAQVRYTLCGAFAQDEHPERRGELDLHLVREAGETFEGVRLPFFPTTPRWAVTVGFAAYLSALRARPTAPHDEADPVEVKDLKALEWNERYILISSDLVNHGTRSVEEVVTEAVCDGDTTGWRVELRPVDPLATLISSLGGATLAAPLPPNETRNFWTRLPEPPSTCERLTMRRVGVRWATAPGQ